jgi:hypothetical protein
MAVRRFHFTGRKKLNRSDAKVFVSQPNGVPEFDAQLSLAGYELPPESLVFVEAYRQTSWMRFACGTVGNFLLPEDRRLTEFGTHEGLLFRVRVTAANDPEGLLLAEADQIRPKESEDAEENRIALLPAKPDDSLGQEVYRIDLEDYRPMLLINSKLGDWRQVARDPVFVSLVFPSAMREVLSHVLRVEKYFGTEDQTDWRAQWLAFALRIPGVHDLPSEDDTDHIGDWITEAVSAFCRLNKTAKTFGQYWTGEGGS